MTDTDLLPPADHGLPSPAHALAARGDWAGAERAFDADVAAAARAGDDVALAVALTNRGHALARLGRLDDADATLRASVVVRERLHAAATAGGAVVARGLADVAVVAAARGDVAEATRLLLDARRLASDPADAVRRAVDALLDATRALDGATLHGTADDATRPLESVGLMEDDAPAGGELTFLVTPESDAGPALALLDVGGDEPAALDGVAAAPPALDDVVIGEGDDEWAIDTAGAVPIGVPSPADATVAASASAAIDATDPIDGVVAIDVGSPLGFEPSTFETGTFAPPAFESSATEPSAFEPPTFEHPLPEPDSFESASFEPASFESAAFEPATVEPAAFEPPVLDADAFEADALDADALDPIATEASGVGTLTLREPTDAEDDFAPSATTSGDDFDAPLAVPGRPAGVDAGLDLDAMEDLAGPETATATPPAARPSTEADAHNVLAGDALPPGDDPEPGRVPAGVGAAAEPAPHRPWWKRLSLRPRR